MCTVYSGAILAHPISGTIDPLLPVITSLDNHCLTCAVSCLYPAISAPLHVLAVPLFRGRVLADCNREVGLQNRLLLHCANGLDICVIYTLYWYRVRWGLPHADIHVWADERSDPAYFFLSALFDLPGVFYRVFLLSVYYDGQW